MSNRFDDSVKRVLLGTLLLGTMSAYAADSPIQVSEIKAMAETSGSTHQPATGRTGSADENLQPGADKDAKTVELTEDFEGSFPPTGWSSYGFGSGVYTWHKDGVDPVEGSYCASCEDEIGGFGQEEFLISPAMDLSDNEPGIYVAFSWKGSYERSVTYNGCDLKLMISTDGGSTFPTTLWTEEDVGVFDNWVWYRDTVSLAAYNVSNVALCWRYIGYTSTSGEEFSIDAIEVFDVVAEVLSSTSPGQNQLNVLPSSNITATFGVDMDPTTFTSSSFVVHSDLEGRISGGLSYDGPSKTATFDPISDFATGDIISVTLTDDIQSDQGAPLDQGYCWSFTVGASYGQGIFDEKPPWPVDEAPKAMGAADFDKDGRVDLIVTHAVDETVAFMKNWGGGNIYTTSYHWIHYSTPSVAVGDFNGDSNMDFACPGASDTLLVALGQGNGGFTWSWFGGLSGELYALTAADFDNDGDVDLAGSCNGGPWQIMLLLNDGSGAFTEFSSPGTYGWVFDLVSRDLDNDGDNDVAVADSSSCEIIPFINDGDGNITIGTAYDYLCNHYALCAGDFNGDGWVDIATHLLGDNNLYVLANDGDGTFTYGTGHGITQYVHQMKAADFNADGL